MSEESNDPVVVELKEGISKFNPNEFDLSTTNTVISSTYTVWNFFPKNLFEQFHNFSNVYFLVIGIFQTITEISVTNGFPDLWPVLGFVMGVSAARAAIEDYRKHQADNERNSAKYKVYTGNENPEEIKSGDLRVGQIVQLEKDQMVPTDMMLMGSNIKHHIAFLDRANLNGETRLEVMTPMRGLEEFCPCYKKNNAEGKDMSLDYSNLKKLTDKLSFGRPNSIFDEFSGEWDNKKTKVDGKSLLMRETNLRNTEFAFGLIVYIGEDTKIQRSHHAGQKPKLKQSKITKKINKYQMFMVAIQLSLCLIGGIFAAIYQQYTWYNPITRDRGLTLVFGFFSYIQILSQMVPISLIVTSEMVKYLQSQFIVWDTKLYSHRLNKPAKVNRSSLHDDLGYVDYIFSDKTGTVTQNKMEFRFLSVPVSENELVSDQGHFGTMETDISRAVERRKQEESGGKSHEQKKWTELLKSISQDAKSNGGDFSQIQKKIADKLNEGDKISINLERFLIHMALSNTVKPYYQNNELKFQADSAEELAMVQFARLLGFTKEKQNPTILKTNTGEKKYNHLATLGFSSKRARVTVIYEEVSNKTIHVMSKGQDSVILPLIWKKEEEKKSDELQDTDHLDAHINKMYVSGLRTLVGAYAETDKKWWQKWEKEYQEIIEMQPTPDGNEKKLKHELYEKIELDANLQYLGLLGLEDQLQELVPETVNDCFQGGIKVWMLTGDKLPAAKNIAIACYLIEPEMQFSYDHNKSVEENQEALRDRRLVEIIGTWSSFLKQSGNIDTFWENLPKTDQGNVSAAEIHECFKDYGAPPKLFDLFKDTKDVVTKKSFKMKLNACQLTDKEAVEYEVETAFSNLKDGKERSLLINRLAFKVIFPEEEKNASENLTQNFLKIAMTSKSVVFARAEPSMKKKMVVEVQKLKPEAITLAIGDGANDTDMILSAHLGVGISGVEGTAAVNAADYALGEFRMLHTLLFVHGFWSTRRIAYMVLFLCYKAFFYVIPAFYWNIFRHWTALRGYDVISTTMFNAAYTALPVMAVGLWDQLLDKQTLEDNPNLYSLGKDEIFNRNKFFLWMFRAFFHGSLVFFFNFIVSPSLDETSFGVTLVVSLISTVTMIGCLDINNFTKNNFLTLFMSYGAVWVFTPIAALLPNMETYGVIDELWGTSSVTGNYNPIFLLVILFLVTFPFIIDFAGRSWKELFYRDGIIEARYEYIKGKSQTRVSNDPGASPEGKIKESITSSVKCNECDCEKFKPSPGDRTICTICYHAQTSHGNTKHITTTTITMTPPTVSTATTTTTTTTETKETTTTTTTALTAITTSKISISGRESHNISRRRSMMRLSRLFVGERAELSLSQHTCQYHDHDALNTPTGNRRSLDPINESQG